MKNWKAGEAIETVKLYAFVSPVTTLDEWKKNAQSELDLDRIVAVKIDTEGLESHVLKGAAGLLKSQKPLIMAEGGHHIGRKALYLNTAMLWLNVKAKNYGWQKKKPLKQTVFLSIRSILITIVQ